MCKAHSAIHGPLCPLVYSIDKANITAYCLENQFRAYDVFQRTNEGVAWKKLTQSSVSVNISAFVKNTAQEKC
jgi:hypothetical protein